MHESKLIGNLPDTPGIAETSNLDLAAVAIDGLLNNPLGLPRLGVLYGPSGWGKSMAARFVLTLYKGYYVQMRSAYTRKVLLEKILFFMGITPEKTISKMLDQICNQLALSKRPLIIDEFDYCAKSDSMLELIRDIHDGSGYQALLCIGEEGISHTLQRSERFHSRVAKWIPAEPANLNDAQQLCKVYSPRVEVADDLLVELVRMAGGSVRRISTNLNRIHEVALGEGWELVDKSKWGNRPFFTGEAPARRV